MRITTAGVVVQNQTITEDLEILAPNVVVRDCAITGSLSIQNADNPTLERVRIDGPRENVNGWTLGKSKGGTFTDVTFTGLGKGVVGDFIVCYRNVDGMKETRVSRTVVVETNADTTIRPVWHFDDRNRTNTDCVTTIALRRVYDMPWRWRSDVGVKIGCFNNVFTREKVIVTGVGPCRLLPSASATCEGTTGDPIWLAGCCGQWNATMDSCLLDASGVTGGANIEWQGGMRGWTLKNTTLKVPAGNRAIDAFDIHKSRIEGCTIVGAVVFADRYSRPLWTAGDMVYCNNVSAAPSITGGLIGVSGAMVTTCPPAPIPPPAAEIPTITVVVPSLPVKLLLVKP